MLSIYRIMKSRIMGSSGRFCGSQGREYLADVAGNVALL